jgi:hypothetical protein
MAINPVSPRVLVRISPLKLGVNLAVVGLLLAPAIIVLLYIFSLFGTQPASGPPVIVWLTAPVVFMVLGFVGGLVIAALFNLSCRITGGVVYVSKRTEPS